MTEPLSSLSPESGRYVLYGGITCPFTHRAMLARVSLALQTCVPLVLARPVPGPEGWSFDEPGGSHEDPVLGARNLREIYLAGDASFAGKASVPALWDRQEARVINQDSRDVVLGFNAHPAAAGADLYPETERARIDADISSFDQGFVRAIIMAGSLKNQADYETAVRAVYDWLDAMNLRLAGQRYLGASAPDFSDLVLFTGLVRFDTCYYFGSRCHLRRIQDYPQLWGYLRDLYQRPGFAQTVDLDAYRASFFTSSAAGRDGVIPLGPDIDFSTAHGRDTVPLRAG